MTKRSTENATNKYCNNKTKVESHTCIQLRRTHLPKRMSRDTRGTDE